MKPGTKLVIAFSTLALAAGGVLAQTTTAPKSDTGASPTQPSAAPAPVTPATPATPKAETPSSPSSAPGATAQGPATTRAPASGGKVTFESLDVNSDGKISKTEAEAQPDLAKEFGKLDKNKDGMLDQTEFRAHKSK